MRSFRSRKPSDLYRVISPVLYVFRKVQFSARKPIVTNFTIHSLITKCLSFSCNLLDFFKQVLKSDWLLCFSKVVSLPGIKMRFVDISHWSRKVDHIIRITSDFLKKCCKGFYSPKYRIENTIVQSILSFHSVKVATFLRNYAEYLKTR